MTWFLLFAVLASVYPLFMIVAPGRAIRMQAEATAKKGTSPKRAGRRVQRLLRIDPDAEPWNDRGAVRRIRVFAAIQILIVWAIVLVAAAVV
jgi:hypothetical protein